MKLIAIYLIFVTLIWDNGVIVPGYFKAMGKRTRLLLVSELELDFEFNWDLFNFSVPLIRVDGVL